MERLISSLKNLAFYILATVKALLPKVCLPPFSLIECTFKNSVNHKGVFNSLTYSEIRIFINKVYKNFIKQ